ncbi:MAG: sulfatase-like hydrolase/transferase [Planctomycetaceae bacterium]
MLCFTAKFASAALVLCLFNGTCSDTVAYAESTRPNIVFIMTDDQGPWALSAAGDPNARTPHLDRLRSTGAILTHCYSPTPVCSPARASVLTGRYGTEINVTDYLPPEEIEIPGLDPRLLTWPRLLSQAGYSTALVGKYHCGQKPESHPTRIGYDEFSGFIHGGMVSRNPRVEIDSMERVVEGWTPDILTDFAIDFIRRKQEGPFALSLHFWAPHANQGSNAEGDRTWLPLSPADLQPFSTLDPVLPEPDYPHLDIARTKRMMREYVGSVHSVDRNVGRLLGVLDGLGLTENTLVIFTSDHGFNIGHHGIWHKGNGRWLLKDNDGARANMWDNSLRVPAIVSWPRHIPANSTVEKTVSHLDWFPTILAAIGVDAPENSNLRGQNILPLLQGEELDRSDDFMAQFQMRVGHADGANMRSFQTKQWKLVRFLRGKYPDEFYDRLNDPDEKTNVYTSTDLEIQNAIRDLDAKLKERMREINDPALARNE